jgi:hypothetical protein
MTSDSDRAWSSRYRFVSFLGKGSFGTVYKVIDNDSKEVLALKELHVPDPAAMERLNREIRVLSELEHENVVDIVEHDKDLQWYAMPLAEYTLLEGVPEMDHGQRAEAILDICRGMSAAHEKNVIHRDVSYKNVLYFEQDRRWKVSDFGLAKRFRGLESQVLTSPSQGFLGNQMFCSPEGAVDSNFIDERSDIFSLGQLIGWISSSKTSLDRNQLTLSDANPWKEIVFRMTAVPQKARPASLRELLPDIEAVCDAIRNRNRESWTSGNGHTTESRDRALHALLRELYGNEAVGWEHGNDLSGGIGLTTQGWRLARDYGVNRGWIVREEPDDRFGYPTMKLTQSGAEATSILLSDEDLFHRQSHDGGGKRATKGRGRGSVGPDDGPPF